ncbi:MAG TPA: ABC transporter substrate-binding protein [Haliangium sp.]|nr:ABC transporter substrate-binding protein [Haliangium sp.]
MGTLLVAGALAALGWRVRGPGPRTLRKVTVGHLVSLDHAPLFVAKEAGYFEEQGLDVELRFFVDIFANNDALAAGEIDFSSNPFTMPYLALQKGVPIRTISSSGGWGVMQVVIQGEYGVSTMRELAAHVRRHPDEKIKVGSFKSDTLDLILLNAFQAEGLTYDDFEMVWYRDLLEMWEAFKRKEVGILSHIKPYTTDLVVNHGARFLTDNATVWNMQTPNCVISVLEPLLENEPEVVQGFLRALIQAAGLINEKPEEAVALLARSDYPHYFQVEDDVVVEALRRQPASITFTPNITAVNAVMFEMVGLSYIEDYIPGRKLFRLDVIKQLESK